MLATNDRKKNEQKPQAMHIVGETFRKLKRQGGKKLHNCVQNTSDISTSLQGLAFPQSNRYWPHWQRHGGYFGEACSCPKEHQGRKEEWCTPEKSTEGLASVAATTLVMVSKADLLNLFPGENTYNRALDTCSNKRCDGHQQNANHLNRYITRRKIASSKMQRNTLRLKKEQLQLAKKQNRLYII